MGRGGGSRPFNVTVVLAVVWAIAIMSVISGLLYFTADAQDLLSAGVSKDAADAYGLYEIIFGFVAALTAVGLGNGNNLSRFLVTALMIARLLAAGWIAINLFGEPYFWVSIGVAALALSVLYLLYTDKANRFFAGRDGGVEPVVTKGNPAINADPVAAERRSRNDSH